MPRIRTRTDEQATPPAGDVADGEGMTAETAVRVMRTTPPPALPETHDDITEDDEELSVSERLRALIASAPSDRVTVKLYRPNRLSRRMEWCCDYAPQDLEEQDLELIRNQWGAGSFELRVIGSRGILSRIQVNIADLPQALAQNPIAAPVSEIGEVLKAIQAQNAALIAALTTRPDPRADMMAQLEMMKAMREAFGPPASAAPAVDQVQMIKGIAEAVRSMREIANEITPQDREDSSDPMSLLGKFLDTAKAIGGQRQAVPQLPAPVTVPASMQPDNEEAAMLAELQRLGQTLAQMAAEKKTTKEGGEFIYQNIPDPLVDFLGHASWFEFASQAVPALAAHKDWADGARTHAIGLFQQEARERAALHEVKAIGPGS